MKFFTKIPLGISGVALALSGLGNLVAFPGGLIAYPLSEYVRYSLGVLAVAVLFLFIMRIVSDLQGVRADLQSSVLFSILPTSTMATILLSTYLASYALTAAQIIWATAAIIQICIMAAFAKRFIRNFKLINVYPSWYVTAVGIQAIAIASPYMGAQAIGQVVFWIGFALYFVITILVIARYSKHYPLPERYRPTVMVLTAPMGICIAGYLSAFSVVSVPLLIFMLLVQAASFCIGLYCLPGLVRLSFYPSLAALGFPTVVNAFAFKRGSEYLTAAGYHIWTTPVLLTELLAIVVVCYVVVRYTVYLYRESVSVKGTACD